jgi:hypothetical protein
MTTDVAAPSRPPSALGLVRPILLGAVLAGTLDILAALTQTLLRGGSPQRLLQAIASGLLGGRAFEGGWWTAVLGLEAHFTIALGAAAVFVLASRIWPWLVLQWRIAGPIYGICVWATMAFVIVPLSLTPFTPQRTLQSVATMILIHMTCVGLPIAWAARPRAAAS